MRIKLSFVQFSLFCYEFCILSKIECESIYYHFRRDHESSFPKLAKNKWICRETCDFFRDQFTLFASLIFGTNYCILFLALMEGNTLEKTLMSEM